MLYQKKNLPYKEFKERLLIYIEELGIKTGLDYLNWSKGIKKFEMEFPKDFPRLPNEYYKEWKGGQKYLTKKNYSLTILNLKQYFHFIEEISE